MGGRLKSLDPYAPHTRTTRFNMSKLPADSLKANIQSVLDAAAAKKRKFVETIELQVVLKNYDTQKDKRFAGSIKLPNIPRPHVVLHSRRCQARRGCQGRRHPMHG